jgi:hypothetical protein
LAHEEGHVTVAVHNVMGHADKTLLPVEKMQFGDRESCERAANAAKQEFEERVRDRSWWLFILQEFYDVNPFLRCGP